MSDDIGDNGGDVHAALTAANSNTSANRQRKC